VHVGAANARRKRRVRARTLRFVRASRRLLARSRARRVCPELFAEWLRSRLLDRIEVWLADDRMRAPDVLEVLDAFAARNVRGLLVGGWGVEALFGEATRRHADLDIAFPASVPGGVRGQERAAAEALAQLGYHPVDTEGRTGDSGVLAHLMTLRDAVGREVQLLTIVDHAEPPVMTGSIAGRPVPCPSAEAQLTFREGYRQRPIDRHDLELLRGWLAADGLPDRRGPRATWRGGYR
jgi:lincosamide nucleotidyltransferase A/C/D/E